jgi:formylmethanofuran dehydrogenase subunit E
VEGRCYAARRVDGDGVMADKEKVLVRCRGCHKKYFKQRGDLDSWRGLCVDCARKKQKGWLYK